MCLAAIQPLQSPLFHGSSGMEIHAMILAHLTYPLRMHGGEVRRPLQGREIQLTFDEYG